MGSTGCQLLQNCQVPNLRACGLAGADREEMDKERLAHTNNTVRRNSQRSPYWIGCHLTQQGPPWVLEFLHIWWQVDLQDSGLLAEQLQDYRMNTCPPIASITKPEWFATNIKSSEKRTKPPSVNFQSQLWLGTASILRQYLSHDKATSAYLRPLGRALEGGQNATSSLNIWLILPPTLLII